MTNFRELLRPTPAGLCCVPGDFIIDPVRPVPRAVITHGHGDHARAGHHALLASVAQFPERTHLVGVYALGKAQRLICLLREAGYDKPIYVHGALAKLNALYEAHGVKLGPLLPATIDTTEKFAGAIVLAPPDTLGERWSRRFADPLPVFASGWMRVRARAQIGRA